MSNKQVDSFLSSIGFQFPGNGAVGKEYSDDEIKNIPRECSGLPYPLNDEQHSIAIEIIQWLNQYYAELKRVGYASGVKTKIWNRMAGLAGTGKTAVIAYLYTQGFNYLRPEVRFKNVAVCTYAWKAALVLRNRGIDNACSIHSLIYKPYEDEKGELKFYRRTKDEIVQEFSAIIVDEASMVDFYMRRDLQEFGIPVLYVGDHGQLPPISNHAEDKDFMEKAEWKLQVINRQAQDSPIIRLAYMARNGEYIDFGRYGNGVMKVDADDDEVSSALLAKMDQVICGTNDTRGILNRNIRRHLGHNVKCLPAKGENLIGTTNLPEHQVFNGQQWECDSDELSKVPLTFGSKKKIRLTIPGTDQYRILSFAFPEDNLFKEAASESIAYKIMKEQEVYGVDFGYAITCHKCLVPNTLVHSNEGLLYLSEINNGAEEDEFKPFEKPFEVSNGLFSDAGVSSFLNNGVAEVMRLVSSRQFKLEGTYNHRLPVIREGIIDMVEMINIKENDRILISNKMMVFPNRVHKVFSGTVLNRNLAKLIGITIMCGKFVNGNDLIFKTKEKHVIFDIQRVFGNERLIDTTTKGEIRITLSDEEKEWMLYLTNPVDVARELRSTTKEIQAAFIRGITFLSKVSYERREDSILFRSINIRMYDRVSQQFIYTLRMMLLNFGVMTSYYLEENKTIRIFGESAINFNYSIKLYHNSFLSNILMKDPNIALNPCNTPIPVGDLVEKIIEKTVEFYPTFKEVVKEIPVTHMIHPTNVKKVVSSVNEYCNEMSEITDFMILEQIANGKLFVDNIIRVEKENRREMTFCLEMKNKFLPIFVQNGIVGSNSQGSSWGKVAVFDESAIFGRGKGNKDNARKWLYTAITRAERKLLILAPSKY